MKKLMLGAIALEAGGAVVAGLIEGAGTDLWKGMKKASALVLLPIAIGLGADRE